MEAVGLPSERRSSRDRRGTCVYTCLLNGYEDLNEQPAARESSLDFVCLTDDPSLRSDTWSLRRVTPLLSGDPGRSQRWLKICPHRVLAEYDVSLYIDNSVLLRRPPEAVIDELLPPESGLACIEHGFRASVLDEFDEVIRLGLDAGSVCREQLEHYRSSDPASLTQRPLHSGFLLRRHNDPRVVAAMELWFAHVLRYSRRDQLSLWYALRAKSLTPLVHRLDNFESAFHTWPVISGRDRSLAGGSAAIALEERLTELERELAVAHGEIRALRAARSRRWAARLRAIPERLGLR